MFTGDNNTWKIAAARAFVQAAVAAALAALAVWTQTDDMKTIIIAAATPALTILGARLGVEGYVDSKP